MKLTASVLFAAFLALSAGTLHAAPLDASAFAYDHTQPLAIHYGASESKQGVDERSISFHSPTGDTVTGVVIRGSGAAPHPPVLFVHWLGEPATTNHTEFEPDARALAKHGVTSLLIDAMWSQPKWFGIRTTATDYQRSIAQVIDLRRSLDVLLAQPNIDASRLTYVGHDFGSMYGALLAGVDPRPQWFVLMAGTTTFSQWYLLGKPPVDKDAYIAQMAPLDPLPYLSRARAKGFLFQFSAHDEYITQEQAAQFFGAAPLPRGMFIYDADHSLATPAAMNDRLAWLREKLGLTI